MNALPNTTRSRLKKIPQTSAVWEGDRRSLGSVASLIDSDFGTDGECIMWVDGSEGAVRAMEMVSADMGPEAVVRTLLRAIEAPHHPAQPARPQKIIVSDRQMQFFLRGALQDLEIKIEYASDLPLIDELFRGFETMGNHRPPSLPSEYEDLLEKTADRLWRNAPWNVLADSDILILELQGCEISTIYVCVMGMMSAEYGILLYRSLESLKQFRFAALSEETPDVLEKAFLAQDCWFLNYEIPDEETDWEEEETTEVIPLFGSLHPFEGMRASLDEEEAKIVYLALEAVLKFCHAHRQKLAQEIIDTIQKTYRLSLPKSFNLDRTFTVTVATSPELTTELLAMEDEINPSELEDTEEFSLPIQEDLIPDGSLVTLGKISWNLIENLKIQQKTYYQSLGISPKGEGLPAILIQTSRAKAQTLIETIREAGGLQAICFNPGSDPFSGDTYDLGMLQTGNSNLYIFAEYPHHLTQHTKALQQWHKSCKQTTGYCSLVITMGITGASRGNPQPKDMLAVFEAKAIAGEELGMGILELMPNFDFD
jgi:hypothetical protein